MQKVGIIKVWSSSVLKSLKISLKFNYFHTIDISIKKTVIFGMSPKISINGEILIKIYSCHKWEKIH